MKVVRKKPGEAPEICEVENTLEALQQEVGGKVEFIRFSTDAAGVVCKDRKGLKPNTTFCGYPVDGTLLVIGWNGKQAFALPGKFIKRVLAWLGRRGLWLS